MNKTKPAQAIDLLRNRTGGNKQRPKKIRRSADIRAPSATQRKKYAHIAPAYPKALATHGVISIVDESAQPHHLNGEKKLQQIQVGTLPLPRLGNVQNMAVMAQGHIVHGLVF
jgi:hypothetical protein